MLILWDGLLNSSVWLTVQFVVLYRISANTGCALLVSESEV